MHPYQLPSLLFWQRSLKTPVKASVKQRPCASVGGWQQCYVVLCCATKQCCAVHFKRAGKQLVLRPLLEAFPGAHCWSVGASDGTASIKLDTLDEGQTRLLACTPASPDVQGMAYSPSCPNLACYFLLRTSCGRLQGRSA